jgi:hypothetical protein
VGDRRVGIELEVGKGLERRGQSAVRAAVTLPVTPMIAH